MWLESYHLIFFSFIEQSMLALLKVVPHEKVIPLLLPDLPRGAAFRTNLLRLCRRQLTERVNDPPGKNSLCTHLPSVNDNTQKLNSSHKAPSAESTLPAPSYCILSEQLSQRRWLPCRSFFLCPTYRERTHCLPVSASIRHLTTNPTEQCRVGRTLLRNGADSSTPSHCFSHRG